MATTGSPKTYYILYGFAEGKLHSRTLEHGLQERGLIKASQLADADVIIGHSGGCLLASNANSVFIDPTGWPEKSFFSKFIDKLVKDMKARKREKATVKFLLKLLSNLWYILIHPMYNLRMVRPYRRVNKPSFTSALACTIIRNEDDSWCTPEIASIYPNSKVYTLPGEHDDCWSNPEPYVEIIQKVANG